MDGNGRWAIRRGLPRSAGHRAGAKAAERVIEAAPALGIRTLTLYAFSSDNWRRPLPEVAGLLGLFRAYLRTETERGVNNGVALNVIGRRDRLPPSLLEAITRAESATAGGNRLELRIAVDYSARRAILQAAARFESDRCSECWEDRFAELLAQVDHGRQPVRPVDVFLRTGGEQRLSDFLLWESAYAELFFRRELWPDFRPGDLAEVLSEFRLRERRFGAVGMDGGSPARVSLIS